MGFVYKYVDTDDDKVKYVGLVNGDEFKNLDSRIKQHKRDNWHKNKKFDVYYIRANSKTDIEFLESAFISFYRTDKWFNSAKSGWGDSDFIDPNEFNWVLYETARDKEMRMFRENRSSVKSISNNNNELLTKIAVLKYENHQLTKRYETELSKAKSLKDFEKLSTLRPIPMFPFSVDDVEYYFKITRDWRMHFCGASYTNSGKIERKFELLCVHKKLYCNSKELDTNDPVEVNPVIGILLSSVKEYYPTRNCAYARFFGKLLDEKRFLEELNEPISFDDLLDGYVNSECINQPVRSVDDDIHITLDFESPRYLYSVSIRSLDYSYESVLLVADEKRNGKIVPNTKQIDEQMYGIVASKKYYPPDALIKEEEEVDKYLKMFGIDGIVVEDAT